MDRTNGSIIEFLSTDRHSEAVSRLEALLEEHWRSPAACHLAGCVYLWQAVAAVESGHLKMAADFWDRTIPHLIVAFFSDAYISCFAHARSETYQETLEPAQVQQSINAARAFVEERLKELAARGPEATDEIQAQRLARLPFEWQLEWEAADRVRRLGGVPNGCVPARCMIMGPKFADHYGLKDTAQEYIKQFRTPARTAIHEFLSNVSGTEDTLSVARREALYCFSDLALPFVYHLADRNGVALDMLKAVSETSLDDAATSTAPANAAVVARKEARELEIRILVGLGMAELHRVQCDPDVVFDQFFAAMDAAQKSDKSSFNVTSPVIRLRYSIGEAISSRADQLADSHDWERALRLAKVLAKLDPTKQRVTMIVTLLKRQAEWSFGEKKDIATAIDCLQRAQIVAPEDQQVWQMMLYCYGRKLHDLSENNNHLEVARCCMEIIEEIHALEATAAKGVTFGSDLKELADRAKNHAAYALMGALEKLGDHADKDFVRLAQAYLYGVVHADSDIMPAAEASRLANQAIVHFHSGEWVAACTNIDKALTAFPTEQQIQQLYENLTATAICKLCELGEIDRAEEIMERARARFPASRALQRANGRISLCRLDLTELLSQDPERIAKLIASIESRMEEEKDLEEMKTRASGYAAIIDPELRIERHLANVNRLRLAGNCAAALALLDEETYPGLNAAVAGFLRSNALRGIGEPEAALEVISQTLVQFPLLKIIHKEKGQTFSQLGRFDEAEDVFLKCQEGESEDSRDSEIIFELGVNAWRAGRNEDAVSQMRLARAEGVGSLEGIWIECMALKRLGRDAEIAPLVVTPLESGKHTPWECLVLRWLQGEVTDDGLRTAPRTKQEAIELHYWLGEKERVFGNTEEGCRLIRLCLADASLGPHYEFQHAQALVLSGQI